MEPSKIDQEPGLASLLAPILRGAFLLTLAEEAVALVSA